MADAEFEEFRQSYEKVSWQSKIPAPFYSLVPDVSEETSPTYSNCDPKTDCDSVELSDPTAKASEGLSSRNEASGGCVSVFSRTGERRRRKLPEIPKHIRASLPCRPHQLTLHSTLPSLEWDSPDSERPLTDADSGHSTAHSPEMPKSLSPIFQPPHGQLCQHVDMLEATHRGLHKFIPRHDDEVEVEIGDPLYVAKEMDDLWCEGVNLRTGRMGIFPSAYAVDTEYSEWASGGERGHRERYLLGYLGSVETLAHKGTGVVCQAVRRVVDSHPADSPRQPCILEVSDQGLRMVDKRKRDQNEPCIDYFYSLKNVSFCAFHPRDHRYLGFITKHPTLQRFACHVFRGTESTRPVAEAVGRAFQRFYQKFIETAYPVEDIYIE